MQFGDTADYKSALRVAGTSSRTRIVLRSTNFSTWHSLATLESTMNRCAWPTTELNIAYHDNEWGVPVHDDRKLFEFLILEGTQAGLNWSTILKKRENYRRAFDNFDARKIARYGERKIKSLLTDAGIVRNRFKVAAAVQNAKAFLAVQKEFDSFDKYIWSFVGGKPIQNRRKSLKEIPSRTPESDAMSKDLLKCGFKFVGSTICHAFMQAVGMVNDHTVDCFRHSQIQRSQNQTNAASKRTATSHQNQ
jgi:DNA-3-methyladenine glycosylase I